MRHLQDMRLALRENCSLQEAQLHRARDRHDTAIARLNFKMRTWHA